MPPRMKELFIFYSIGELNDLLVFTLYLFRDAIIIAAIDDGTLKGNSSVFLVKVSQKINDNHKLYSWMSR